MTHKVINTFKEKHDNDRVYESGKLYPQGDYKPSKKRLEELSKRNTKYGMTFLEELPETKPKTEKKNKKKE